MKEATHDLREELIMAILSFILGSFVGMVLTCCVVAGKDK